MKNKGHKYRYRPNTTALLLLKLVFQLELLVMTSLFSWSLLQRKTCLSVVLSCSKQMILRSAYLFVFSAHLKSFFKPYVMYLLDCFL